MWESSKKTTFLSPSEVDRTARPDVFAAVTWQVLAGRGESLSGWLVDSGK